MSSEDVITIETTQQFEDTWPLAIRELLETGSALPRTFGVVNPPDPHGRVSTTCDLAVSVPPEGTRKRVYWSYFDDSGSEDLVVVQWDLVHPTALEEGEFRPHPPQEFPSYFQVRFLENLAEHVQEALPDLHDIARCADFDQTLENLIATLAKGECPVELTEWVEKYRLEVDWIREATISTLLETAVARQERKDPPKKFSVRQGRTGEQPTFDFPLCFEATWNPFEERIDEAEQRLISCFRTEIRFRMERRAGELDSEGYSRTYPLPGNRDKRINEAREMDVQWLVLFQCEGMSWEQLAKRFPTTASPENRRDDIRKRVISMASELGITLRTR